MALLFLAVPGRLLPSPPTGHPPARRLGILPGPSIDKDYPNIYNGLKNQAEAIGQPEFEAALMLDQESQLDQLSDLVLQFKRTMADTRETMRARFEELNTFLGPE